MGNFDWIEVRMKLPDPVDSEGKPAKVKAGAGSVNNGWGQTKEFDCDYSRFRVDEQGNLFKLKCVENYDCLGGLDLDVLEAEPWPYSGEVRIWAPNDYEYLLKMRGKVVEIKQLIRDKEGRPSC